MMHIAYYGDYKKSPTDILILNVRGNDHNFTMVPIYKEAVFEAIWMKEIRLANIPIAIYLV